MKLTVLVVGTDVGNSINLTRALERSDKIETVRSADNHAAAFVLAKEADLIIFDQRSWAEGFDLMESLMAAEMRPGVLVMASFYTREMLLRYQRIGTVTCVKKPAPFQQLLDQIERWIEGEQRRIDEPRNTMLEKTEEALRGLGMSELHGYELCRLAVGWICRHGYLRGCFSNKLYPFLAEATGQSELQVERNIRYAIGQMWSVVTPEAVERYLGADIAKSSKRPENLTFLCAVADYVNAGDGP